jgi:hypothetical protein
MPSYSFALTETYQQLIDFKKFGVSYFNIEVENFDGEAMLEFTFGNPDDGAKIELRVPSGCSLTRDNRPLKGVLYGRCVTGAIDTNIIIW